MPFEPRYKTLVDLFDQSVKDFASRDLFGTKTAGRWSFTSYAEFGSLVSRCRAGLTSLGVTRGDRVALVSNNRLEWPVVAFACYGIGAALVPMYEAQSPKEWEFVVRDCEAKVLIVANGSVLDKARAFCGAIPTLTKLVVLDGAAHGDGGVASYASLLALPPIAGETPGPDDVANILYTSGTTGNPKGVVLTHRNIASNVSAAHEVFPVRATDRSLSILPWAHAFGGTAELHTLISFGASMAICEGADRILDNFREVKPTILACVPTVFNRLYVAVQQQLAGRPEILKKLVARALRVKNKERGGGAPSLPDQLVFKLVDRLVFEKVRARLGGRLKFAICGGAALSPEVAEFVEAIGVIIFEGFGLTETSPVVTANGPGARRIGSVGRAFPGVRVVIDPSTAERNPTEVAKGAGVEGEVVVYGPNVMKGYYHRPEETAAVFTGDGGFRTGDLGYLDADDFLFITGRIKEQYKLENGKYVAPSPLEEKLKLSPYVANVMVYGENRPYNVAVVAPNLAAIQKWANETHVSLPSRTDEVLRDDRVRRLIAAEIREHSAEFKGFERVRDFVLVSGEFTVESGMLTPKMSLKRRKVIEAYGDDIDDMYAKSAAGKDAEAFARG